ncbi:uncharacterized protein LOC122805110 [Protopterus annectens]|uniref:uncharacterized protein LOC122805110 n=1 Tax=Protopterus annectens TaxID=7888 RepID=UPI001CFB88E0|nr:uncharacterized protein LOC122805110 [Protopterus annectens]
MAGTTVFSQTVLDMQRSRERMKALLEKIELLWQQTLSKVHLPLKAVQSREKAEQIINLMSAEVLKLQSCSLEVPNSMSQAKIFKLQYETGVYSQAMELIRYANTLLKDLEELNVLEYENNTEKDYYEELRKVKESFQRVAELHLNMLKATYEFYITLNKVSRWYCSVFYQVQFKEATCSASKKSLHPSRKETVPINPAWQEHVHNFQRENPPPAVEELVHLRQFSNLAPEVNQKKQGNCLSYRCVFPLRYTNVIVLHRILIQKNIVDGLDFNELFEN